MSGTFSRSSSNAGLIRSDSGIDVISIEGVTTTSHRDWDSFASVDNHSALPAGTDKSKRERLIEKLQPVYVVVAKYVAWGCVLGAFFGATWAIVPEEMQPGKSLFGLTITVLSCIVAEKIVIRIPTPKGLPPLPPLLASLLTGLALRNIPGINVAADIHPETSTIFREVALTIILTRAGLEIEPEAMKKAASAIARLAFLPCIAEACAIGILSHYILGFPFEWSFMTGFMIAAVSPAVVIPSLILLQEAGYGVEKGIPSLVMAASGIDDVLAIAGFTVLLGIAIPTGLEEEIINIYSSVFIPGSFAWFEKELTTDIPLRMNASHELTTQEQFDVTDATTHHPGYTNIGKEIGGAIVEILIGIISGLVLGFFLSFIPTSNMKYKNFCRAFLLLSIGILFVFGTTIWGIPGSGSLCALIMSFTASMRWKDEKQPLAKIWHHMWTLFQPILFGLTGSLVDVQLLDGTTVGLGLAVMGSALVFRLLMSTAVTFGLHFNIKEKLFISIAWLPKGTVQAALGSAALDQARATGASEQELRWGEQILVMAVLITLITAPIGGFGINVAAPRFLSTATNRDVISYKNKAYNSEEELPKTKGSRSSDSKTEIDCISKEKRLSHCSGLKLNINELSLDGIKEEDENFKREEKTDVAPV